MQERDWVVEINEKLKEDVGPLVREWERHSIYKVPSHVTKLNENAYIPRVVSFGPYHHGEDHLKAMEDHKHRALIHFLKRSKNPIESIYRRIDKVVDELRNSYNPQVPIMEDKPKFLQMMILDGCFMLEILRVYCDDSVPDDDYAVNDPVFGEHGKLYARPYILRDMIMLENQLPLTLLRMLIEVATDTSQGKEFNLIHKIPNLFGTFNGETRSIGKCMHVLDVCRKIMIQQGPTRETCMPKATCIKRLFKVDEEEEEEEEIIRSATELQEAGISFKKSHSYSLRDVSFAHGVLWLPPLLVDDTTEYMFLNLIAFERLYFGAGNEVSSYVCFMDRVIDTEMDVAILHRKGILINHLGSDKVVAKMFNSLAKEVSFGGDRLDEVRTSLSNYYRYKPWKKWRANLLQTYFRNPWASISLIAAFCLFALTIIQTVYTVIGYYDDDDEFERLESTKKTFHCVWHMIFFSCHK